MGRLFKPKWTRGGKTHTNRIWHCEYTGPDGSPVRASTTCRDKAAALQVLARLEREAEQVRVGLIPAGAPDAKRPLAELLTAFDTHLRDQGRSDGHRKNVRTYVPRVIAACQWATFADLAVGDVAEWIRDELAGTAERAGVSPATVNTHLAPLKTFSRWAAEECGGGLDPLRKLRLLNPDLDPRRDKYTPTPEELAAVVVAATRAPRRLSVMSGPDRAMLYRVAACSGFRAAELASLTPHSFAWAGGRPADVTVQARHAKSRRTETVPLPAPLGAILGPWLLARPPDERCWPGTWAKERKQSSWLKRDCRRAGTRRFTFHGLRRMYSSELVESGATVAEFQELVRHKSATTTLKHYVRAKNDGVKAAVERLPCLPFCLSVEADIGGLNGSKGGKVSPLKGVGKKGSKKPNTSEKSGKSGSARGGT